MHTHKQVYNVDVTQEHIDKGVAKDLNKCPVALAVIDALPHAWDVVVYGTTIVVHTGVYKYKFLDRTQRVTNFISKFDEQSSVKPFKFSMDRIERIHIGPEELNRIMEHRLDEEKNGKNKKRI